MLRESVPVPYADCRRGFSLQMYMCRSELQIICINYRINCPTELYSTTEVTNLALASGRLSENNSRLKPLPEDGRQVEEEPLDAQDERDIDCGKNTIIIMYSFCMG